MPRAIGYIRVSSVGGRSGPEYHTLQIQRESIERSAARNSYELIDVLTDEDASGKTRDRPQFKIAMERILAGEADAIIVWKVSRFSRSWRQAAEDVELLLDNGKDLLSEEGFDTATAGGRLLLRILFSMANWEHDVLGEHWEVIKTKAVRDRGSFLGNAPIGYVSGKGGILEPDPNTKHLVVEIFERRAAGIGLGVLADYLDEVKPRPLNRRDHKDIRRIITSRVYLGEVRWRDEIRTDAHPALVTPELWARANAVTAEPPPTTRSPARDFPLTGWLHCSGCGGSMGGSMDNAYGGKKVPNYKCSRRRGGCPRPQVISARAAEKWALKEGAPMHSVVRPTDQPLDDAALLDLAETERALHDLASLDVRRELGDDWLPMMRKLRAEKVAKEMALRSQPGAPTSAVAWDDMVEADQWFELRRMAPAGALVGPAHRGGAPADRLAFIVHDLETDAMTDR